MEDVLHAIVLGIVQGLTEFLPISSSGHLIVVRDLFGWEFTDDLTFDVALHLGTTAAVIAYFWSEWLQMGRSLLARLLPGATRHKADGEYDDRLLFMIALGSVPVAIVGLVLNDFVEDEVRDPLIVGAMLVAFGGVLLVCERIASGDRGIASTGWRDALSIGSAQAISLVPGVSRSGITISAGLLRGYGRADAARLSFLLATPAILGAGLLKSVEAVTDGIPSEDLDVIAVGALVSAIVGWVSIGGLLRLIRTSSYLPFVVYRVIAGVFIIGYFI